MAADPFMLVEPFTIDQTNLVSTTAVQIETEWDIGTTYNTEDRVAYEDNVYQSLVDSNTGNQPDTSPTEWAFVSVTNPYKMFDSVGSTFTTGSAPMEWVFDDDRIDTMALLELSGINTVRIQAYNAIEGTYYDRTFDIEDSTAVMDWYDYFFSPINLQDTLVVTDIPPITNSRYTITADNESGSSISVGSFIAGKRTEFGFTEYNAKIGITDYSRKNVDEFGNVVLTRRKFAKNMDVKIAMDTSLVDAVAKRLADVRSTIVLWIAAANSYDSLTIFGYYQDFSIDIAFPELAYCTLDIEGVV